MGIFRSIIPIVIFTVINSCLCILLKKGFGKTLPLTFMASVFMMLLSQILFGTFRIGEIALLILFIVSLYVVLKNRDKKQYYLSNGFYVFAVLCAIFLFINFGRHFFWDDEVGFWGKMIKEMHRLDKFYFVHESKLRGHLEYPPFATLFEMLWCKLSLGYSECNATFALHILEFGLVLPIIFDDSFNGEKKFRIVYDLLISICFVGIIVYLDAANVFNAIYSDTLIALEFLYCVYLVYSKETDNYFGALCFAFGTTMIMMTKQVGLAFFLLAVFYYFINNIRSINKITVIGLALGILLPVIFYFGWNKLVEPYDVVRQFGFDKLSVSGFMDIFKGDTYQLETMKLYINALFKKNIYAFPIPVTFLSSLIVEILLLEVLKRVSGDNKGIFQAELTCFVGTAGYALLMLVLYVFCYPEREALVLGSYERYMSSFVSAMFVFVLAVSIDKLRARIEKYDLQKLFIVFLLVAVIFDGNRLLNFVPQIILGNRFAPFESLANKIDEKIEEDSKLFIVYDHDRADDYPAFMSYYSEKTFYTKRNRDLLDGDYSNSTDLKNIINELKEYDYIYVVETSETFREYFKDLIDGEYKDNTLYRVTDKNDQMKLEVVD